MIYPVIDRSASENWFTGKMMRVGPEESRVQAPATANVKKRKEKVNDRFAYSCSGGGSSHGRGNKGCIDGDIWCWCGNSNGSGNEPTTGVRVALATTAYGVRVVIPSKGNARSLKLDDNLFRYI